MNPRPEGPIRLKPSIGFGRKLGFRKPPLFGTNSKWLPSTSKPTTEPIEAIRRMRLFEMPHRLIVTRKSTDFEPIYSRRLTKTERLQVRPGLKIVNVPMDKGPPLEPFDRFGCRADIAACYPD
ncbi:hypothetical protein Nepgr_030508 [Nepenthes gracilis]|uniref:Uncharacterized protein n=1 Tax=Nepenthes gracilis TaxID=150966 RepID=A0AAD3Y5T6_NEPGR|nr:hypothetical protein Nepgr_030508 [Nepenthes gracilis]